MRVRDCLQLSQKVFLAQVTFALAGVDPDGTGEIARCLNELRPVLPSIGPSNLVSIIRIFPSIGWVGF